MKNNRKYMPLNIQKFSDEIEVGTTIQINGSATLTDVDTSKESRVLRLLGQTSQTGTPTPSSPIPVNVVSGDNTIEICGKNLFSTKTNNLFVNNNREYIQTANNVYGCIGKVKPNSTYTIKKYGGNRFYIVATNEYPNNGTPITNRINSTDGGTQITFTTGENDNYIFCYYSNASADVNIQLEKGSTATTYEPYIGNTYPIYLGDIELCKIGDYQDYIYKDNGSWYLHKEIGKVVLDGSNDEIWSKSGATTETSFVGAFNLISTGISNKFATGSTWLCDKFTYGSLGVDYKFNTYNGDATQGYIFFGITIPATFASDINTFRTWLGNNNVTLYYVLKEPIATEITDATLKSQLEALQST